MNVMLFDVGYEINHFVQLGVETLLLRVERDQGEEHLACCA